MDDLPPFVPPAKPLLAPDEQWAITLVSFSLTLLGILGLAFIPRQEWTDLGPDDIELLCILTGTLTGIWTSTARLLRHAGIRFLPRCSLLIACCFWLVVVGFGTRVIGGAFRPGPPPTEIQPPDRR